MRKIIYGTILVVVALLSLAFAVKNPQDISIEYYFGLSWTGSLSLLLLIVLALGILIGVLSMLIVTLKTKQQAAKAKRRARRVEKEVENLRSLPLREEV